MKIDREKKQLEYLGRTRFRKKKYMFCIGLEKHSSSQGFFQLMDTRRNFLDRLHTYFFIIINHTTLRISP